jgi:hypothetical protein
MPVILATQEDIRRLLVQSQPRKIVCETLSQKKTYHTKKRTGGVAQSVGFEFKP